jgi:hypothetical protein
VKENVMSEETAEEKPKKRRIVKRKAESIDSPVPTQPKDEWAEAAAVSAEVQASASDSVEEFEDVLQCVLSKEELAAKGVELAEIRQKIREVEAEKKARMSAFKTELDGLEEESKELDMALTVGSEDRPVKCRIEHLFSLNTVRKTRLDTNEVYSESPMTAAERQAELPLFAAKTETIPAPPDDSGVVAQTEETNGIRYDDSWDQATDGPAIDDPQSVLDAEDAGPDSGCLDDDSHDDSEGDED